MVSGNIQRTIFWRTFKLSDERAWRGVYCSEHNL